MLKKWMKYLSSLSSSNDCFLFLDIISEVGLDFDALVRWLVFSSVVLILVVSFLAELAVNVFLEVFLFNSALLQVSVEVASSVSEFAHFRGYTKKAKLSI